MPNGLPERGGMKYVHKFWEQTNGTYKRKRKHISQCINKNHKKCKTELNDDESGFLKPGKKVIRVVTDEMQPVVLLNDIRKCRNNIYPGLESFPLEERQREMENYSNNDAGYHSLIKCEIFGPSLEVKEDVKVEPLTADIQKDLHAEEFNSQDECSQGPFKIHTPKKEKDMKLELEDIDIQRQHPLAGKEISIDVDMSDPGKGETRINEDTSKREDFSLNIANSYMLPDDNKFAKENSEAPGFDPFSITQVQNVSHTKYSIIDVANISNAEYRDPMDEKANIYKCQLPQNPKRSIKASTVKVNVYRCRFHGCGYKSPSQYVLGEHVKRDHINITGKPQNDGTLTLTCLKRPYLEKPAKCVRGGIAARPMVPIAVICCP